MLFAAVAVLSAQSDPSWRQPVDPQRIAGNIYYVGTRGLSSFLIVTPAGAILIDTGEAASVPFIRANVERLGVHLSDVRLLLAGHAHFDHVGGHAEMKRLTGATVVAMEADREAIASGVDRSALGGPGWTPVAVGKVVKDGGVVSLGGVALTAHLTPGHTQGCTTWTTDVMQDGKRYRVAFVCSVTVNEGVRLVGNTRVPAIAEHYAQAFRGTTLTAAGRVRRRASECVFDGGQGRGTGRDGRRTRQESVRRSRRLRAFCRARRTGLSDSAPPGTALRREKPVALP